MGLFEILFARVMAVVVATLAIMVVVSQINQDRYLNEAWREDLRQEAAWTVLYFGFTKMRDRDDPPGWQDWLRRDWRATHDAVRLTVRDEKQAVIFDSHTGSPPPTHDSPAHLTGYATIQRPEGSWELLLSRPRPPATSFTLEVVLAAALSAALAALLLFPLTRRLSRSLAMISTQARGIAEGEFGASLDVKGVRELKTLAAAFNIMSSRLKDEQARRRRLIGDVSHELRSPLSRLRALGEMIARRPHELEDLLERTVEEVQLLERLVADLLETARLEQQPNYVQLNQVPLKQWWSQATSRLQLGAEAKGARINVSDAGDDVRAYIDAQRLVQALGNLIDNSVSASADQPTPVVSAHLDISRNSWSVEITDQGRGIPATSLPHVFERFYRVDEDRARATGGVGLGLSIVKAIVEAHGGSIEIESELGRGTRVRLLFPLSPAAPRTDEAIGRARVRGESTA